MNTKLFRAIAWLVIGLAIDALLIACYLYGHNFTGLLIK